MHRRCASPIVLLMGLSLAGSAAAQGVIIVPEPVPHPTWPERVTTTPLEVKYQRIHAEIVDGVAVTSVRQTFRNPLRQPVEGTYVFPLPDGVAVGDFTMTADGKTLKGEVLEKDRARQTYEAIVRRARDPGLLEYLGSRLYQASIFPIPPGGQIDVTISYSQTLAEQSGLGAFTHPLRMQQPATGTIGELAIDVRVRTSQPLATVFCPTHNCSVARPGDREAVVSFEQTHAAPDRDFTLYYQRSDAQFGLALLTHRTAGEAGYFLLRVSPRRDVSERDTQPKDIAFVVDTSGSMQGGKIAQARRALKFCINSLRDADRFNIYAFSTDVRPFRDALVAATSDQRAAAGEFAERLEAVGGTNIHQALHAALRNDPGDESRPYLIVFVTDGQPTVDVTDPEAILRSVGEANRRRVRFHVFGVGSDVNTHLLDKLAEMNRGSRDYCTEAEDLELKLGGFVARLANPVLTDVTLTLVGLRAIDVYPRTLPDLFHGDDFVVLGRYEDSGQHAIRLEGRIRGEAKSTSYEGEFPKVNPQNDFLPRLWANRKVAYLLDEIRLRGPSTELVDEVVRLAKRYGIVTPYTSALIQDDAQPVALRGAVPQDMRVYYLATPKALAARRGGGASDVGGPLPAAASVPVVGFAGADAVEASLRLRVDKDAAVLPGASPADLVRDEAGRPLLRRAGDKTFTWDGGRYVDSAWDGRTAPRTIVAFSPEYFELLRNHPQVARFLAISERVLVVFDGVVYEFLPAAAEPPKAP